MTAGHVQICRETHINLKLYLRMMMIRKKVFDVKELMSAKVGINFK